MASPAKALASADAREAVLKELPDFTEPRAVAWGTAVSRGVGWILLGLGTHVLIGWGLDVPLLTGIHPLLASMKANTAVAFALTGASLLLLWARAAAWPARVTGLAFAGIVVTLAALTLGPDLFSWTAGIDEVLVTDTRGRTLTSSPG